jgi:hypothetical protein
LQILLTAAILQILLHGAVHFAEVKFYFSKRVGADLQAFAMASLYSPPNEYLLQKSFGTLAVCEYRGEEALVIIEAKSILSVVAMVPFGFLLDGRSNQYFMIEQTGLDVVDVDVPEDSE